MIRVITGLVKNKKLKSPEIPGFRAVQDIAKGAVFSILGDAIVESTCLDLFAGSGNLGIEALSRGAKWVDFIDVHYDAIKAINENLGNCNLSDRAAVIKRDSVKYAANTEKKYDFIFCDPFYDNTSHIFLLENLEEILNPKGIIIFFHGDNFDIDKNLKNTKLSVLDNRRFGKSHFAIFGKN